jgi:NitT/TauT family transport system substrate-binding protein
MLSAALLWRLVLISGIATVTAATVVVGTTARADEIVVSQYGVAAGGWPFAIAMEKGFFKDEGLNITGIISSQGGGTSVRNLLASTAPYAEISPGVVVDAIQQGAKLKIVSDNALSVADIAWVVRADSPMKTIADLKGHKLGYTNPRSTTQGLSMFLLAAAKLKPEDVELVRTGGFGEGLTALGVGLVDATPIGEPLLSQNVPKFRVLAWGPDVLPPLDNVDGVVTEVAAETQGDKIRAIIRARRTAVKFMYEHPDEAGEIVAKSMNVTAEIGRKALRRVIAINISGVPYFGEGQFHLDGLQRMVDVQKSLGAVKGDVDLAKYIDTRFLPDDLKQPVK